LTPPNSLYNSTGPPDMPEEAEFIRNMNDKVVFLFEFDINYNQTKNIVMRTNIFKKMHHLYQQYRLSPSYATN
jgi:hypothetical protein